MSKHTMLVLPLQLPLFTQVISGIGGRVWPDPEYPCLSRVEVPKHVELKTLQNLRDSLEELCDMKFVS